MYIRPANPSDCDAISALIRSVAHYFTVHPEGVGAEQFLQTIEPASIQGYVTAPNIDYWVGMKAERLVGVAAVRDNTHLLHLFVDAAFQGQGAGRELWRHAKAAAMAAGNQTGFTVNSTPYAVPVYQTFGFHATGERMVMHGVAFVPMALRFETG